MIVNEKLTFRPYRLRNDDHCKCTRHGEEPLNKAKALGLAGLVSGLITWFRDATPIVIPTMEYTPL